MRLNPVFEKEMKRNSRSSRISWIIFVCNLLLAVVAFVCYFGESSQLGYLAPVSYSVPMNCYTRCPFGSGGCGRKHFAGA